MVLPACEVLAAIHQHALCIFMVLLARRCVLAALTTLALHALQALVLSQLAS